MKNLFNIAAVSVLMLSVLATANAQKLYYKSGTFAVISATKNTIYPGVMGSLPTQNWQMTLKLKRHQEISFDSAWVDGFRVAVFVGPTDGNTPIRWRKGRTFQLTMSVVAFPPGDTPVSDGAPEWTVSEKAAPPVKHTGELLFRYGWNGKWYYFSGKNFRKSTDVYAP